MNNATAKLLKKWNDTVHSYSLKDSKFMWYTGLNEDLVEFLSIIKRKEVRTVLDIGCGDGTNLIPLAEMGFFVTGIDISPNGLKACQRTLEKEKLHNCVLVEGNMVKMPFIDNSFDFVLSTFAIGEMLLFPGVLKKDAVKSIEESYRVLKKNRYGLLQLTEKVVKEYKTKIITDKILEKKEWINIIKKTGFKIVGLKENSFKDPPHSGATHGYNKPHTHYWTTVIVKK